MTAFLVIGGVGVTLLLVSVVLGDVFDGVFELGGSDLFSGAALAGFLGALGFGGALAYDATGSTGVGIAVGVAAGLAIGLLVGWVMAKLRHDGDDASIRSSDLVWREGTVVSAIPTDGYGEVSVLVGGHLTKLNARAAEALPPGTPIVVTGVLSPTSVSVESR
ncbi:MAG: hypothetical protein R2731_06020 [Nocardioides sp.]